MKKQLLCTFSSPRTCESSIREILENYTVSNNKIFIFENASNNDELFLSYCILHEGPYKKLKGTMGVHRKIETNTLYTLNAMNKIVMDENSGVLDKDFRINWELYSNSLLLADSVSIKIIPLNLVSIKN